MLLRTRLALGDLRSKGHAFTCRGGAVLEELFRSRPVLDSSGYWHKGSLALQHACLLP